MPVSTGIRPTAAEPNSAKNSDAVAAPWSDLAEQSNLSPRQFLIWLGQKLNAGVPLYNMALSFTISGGLDPGRFEAAFRALV